MALCLPGVWKTVFNSSSLTHQIFREYRPNSVLGQRIIRQISSCPDGADTLVGERIGNQKHMNEGGNFGQR